jgi:S-DNA-T family DNA segregation ATPase FtsK/SpoIIIE
MELLLTVGVPAGGTRLSRFDVSVDLDPTTPVAELTDGLAGWATRHGLPCPADPVLAPAGDHHRPLPPELSVFDAGILSGAEVHLLDREATSRTPPGPIPTAPTPSDQPAAAANGAPPEAIALDVTSGPEAGRTIVLRAGSYTVGRASGCAITLDDPYLSRHHFTIEVSPSLDVTLQPNAEATNGTLLSALPLEGPAPLRHEEAVFAGSTQLVLRAARADAVGKRDRLGQVSFNRLPYRRPLVRERKLEALTAPPDKPGRRRFPMATLLIPILGAILFVYLTKQIEFLLLAGLSPLMMVSNHISEGRSSKSGYGKEKADFLRRLETRATAVDEALAEERRERAIAAPDIPLLARQAAGRLGRLWERPRQSPDFLEVRVGLGTLATRILTPLDPGGDPQLRDLATERLARHRELPMVPVTVPLNDLGVTGLFGEREPVRGLGTALVVQAATLHSPEDLVIVAAIPSEELAGWAWLKWLPHCRSVTSPVEGPQLVDGDGVDGLVRALLSVVVNRSTDDRVAGAPWPRVLFIVHQGAHVNRALLATLLDVAPAAGIITLWIGAEEDQLPRHCRATIRCLNPGERMSVLRHSDPELDNRSFELEGIPAATADAIARTLAPVRDVSAASVTTGIPRLVTLLDVPGLPAPDPRAIAASWAARRPYRLDATIGMGAEGPVTLDLVSEGPHALIAGTSGAGKSELLQTLVLALATRYPPERLNFLFIDYKGGASSSQFAALPHTVGSVTNLDERRALRALASLRAELRRRMAVLEGRAKDLAEMLEVAPTEAPPSMVLVVDEFATLVKEIPDFVAGMVDVAQRGRSLGIHLVLATQRPTGAVNDNILANTNLRIALRVLDTADSRAVIGDKDAAAIPVPLRGRAFARTGPGSLTPFQCAWAGAPFLPEQQAAAVIVQGWGFGRVAAGEDTDPAAAQGAGPGKARAETQLAAVVRACRAAADQRGMPLPRRPWVEPLPDQLRLEQVLAADPPGERARGADPGRYAVLGLADLPDEQQQVVEAVDLEAEGGLLVFGGGGSGKTTLLRTIAAGLAQQGSPDDVRLYVLDFSGRSLTQLAELPHVVAAVAGEDLEKVTRTLTALRTELDRRRRLLADARVESVSALRARPGSPPLPRLVVLLDSYAGFHSTFEVGTLYNWILVLQQLVSEGRQVGIHVVMTTSRQLGVPTALTSAIAARVVLKMATAEELMGLGVPNQLARGAELAAGRGFVHGGTELQVATVSEEPSANAQAAWISALAGRLRAGGTRAAERLQELPEEVRLEAGEMTVPGEPLRVPLGLADLALTVATVDLGRQNLVVLGPPMSGRSSALATVARALSAARGGLRLVGLGGLTSPLAQLTCWDIAGFGRSRQQGAIEEAGAVIEGYEGGEVKLVLVLDSAEDLEAMEYASMLERLVRSDAVRVVATVDAATLGRAYSGWLAELRRNRAVLVLQPESAGEVEAVAGAKPSLRPGQLFPPGRGVLVDHGRSTLIQVALPA